MCRLETVYLLFCIVLLMHRASCSYINVRQFTAGLLSVVSAGCVCPACEWEPRRVVQDGRQHRPALHRTPEAVLALLLLPRVQHDREGPRCCRSTPRLLVWSAVHWSSWFVALVFHTHAFSAVLYLSLAYVYVKPHINSPLSRMVWVNWYQKEYSFAYTISLWLLCNIFSLL